MGCVLVATCDIDVRQDLQQNLGVVRHVVNTSSSRGVLRELFTHERDCELALVDEELIDI